MSNFSSQTEKIYTTVTDGRVYLCYYLTLWSTLEDVPSVETSHWPQFLSKAGKTTKRVWQDRQMLPLFIRKTYTLALDRDCCPFTWKRTQISHQLPFRIIMEPVETRTNIWKGNGKDNGTLRTFIPFSRCPVRCVCIPTIPPLKQIWNFWSRRQNNHVFSHFLMDITDHRVAVAHKGHLFHPGVNKASLTRLWSCLEVMFIAFGKCTHGNMEVQNKRKTQQSNTQKHTHKKKTSGTGLMCPVNNGVTISHSEKCVIMLIYIQRSWCYVCIKWGQVSHHIR